MTTYNTGNPLGSVDVKDLYDNAENLDDAVNSLDPTWVDRFGRTRSTMQGVITDAVTASELAASDGASKIGYQPAGTGAVPTTVQSKLRETVSVKDFGAVGDGVADDTAAIENALLASNNVYFPAGTYITTKAIRLSSGKNIYGDGQNTTNIRRTDTTPETIGSDSVVAVVYVSSRYNSIRDLQILGDRTGLATAATVDGIYFGDLGEMTNNSSFTNLIISSCNVAMHGRRSAFMCTFDQILCRQCVEGWKFSYPVFGTSLTFNSCWIENCGTGYQFNRVLYSTMNSCGADYVSYTSTGNPYGFGFGSRSTSRGIYDFESSTFTLNSCAAENSFGSGAVTIQGNCFLTINSLFVDTCSSTFVPNYGSFGNVAVGPIYVREIGAGSVVTINATRINSWSNPEVATNHPTRPIASLLAFNYLESTYGDLTGRTLAVITSATELTNDAIKGIAASKYCKTIDQLFRDPVFIGRVSQGSKFSRQINVSGSGTVITIPFVSQSSINRKHKLTVSGINNQSNGSFSNAFSVDIGCTSLTSLSNLTSGNLFGVTSVAISGLNLNITLPSSVTGARIYVDVLSEAGSLIDLDNISIA
jgi:hypothetical protein